jgi:dCMP deaminase
MMQTITGYAGEGAVYASYLKQAYRFAQHSPDPSTQVGCVIVHPTMGVIAGASNALPEGLKLTEDRLKDHSQKSIYMEHAERNALYRCCQSLLSTTGCHAYVTLAPCVDCARGLIQSGITQVVAHREMLDLYAPDASMSRRASIEQGWNMLCEAGIKCALWSGLVFQVQTVSVRVRGKQWTP